MTVSTAPLAYLPSPSSSVWQLGPIPIRAYALSIIAGILLAVVVGQRRWTARGGLPGTVADVATYAVPAGILGARIYHVITSPERYLADPIRALYIWEGGLGIPGGIAGGALAVWLICRRRGIAVGAFGDAVAPGVALAQAVGRLGNWFNQELFGRPTTLPWGLEIDPDNPDAVVGAEAYHPTFLYEALWNVGVAGFVIWADRRFRLGHGRAFALYLAGYATGRLWIEGLRIDEANELLGLRLNQVVMAVVLVGALAYFFARRGATREEVVQPQPEPTDTAATDDTAADTADEPADATASTGASEAGPEPERR